MKAKKLAQIHFVRKTAAEARLLEHTTHCACCRRLLEEYEVAADAAHTPAALASLVFWIDAQRPRR